MIIPRPEPGRVIGYSYLWSGEAEAGLAEGRKDRPCAIILVVTEAAGERRVTVLPITHRRPTDQTSAVEIPAAVKSRLGLDEARSWVIVSEANEFTWPGYDLRQLPLRGRRSIDIGLLPPNFFNLVRQRYIAFARANRTARIVRTE